MGGFRHNFLRSNALKHLLLHKNYGLIIWGVVIVIYGATK